MRENADQKNSECGHFSRSDSTNPSSTLDFEVVMILNLSTKNSLKFRSDDLRAKKDVKSHFSDLA